MKHVLFDVDGVLIDGFHADPSKRVLWTRDLEEDLGLSVDLLEEVFFQKFFPSIILGKVSLEDGLSDFLTQIGSTLLAEDVIEYWLEKDSCINEDALSLARNLLKKGCVVHIATNQEHRRAKYLWEKLGFNKSFSNIFYAADLGVAKPNVEFFEKVLFLLNVKASDVCLIDDSPENICVVEKLGMTGIIFDTSDGVKDHPFFQ